MRACVPVHMRARARPSMRVCVRAPVCAGTCEHSALRTRAHVQARQRAAPRRDARERQWLAAVAARHLRARARAGVCVCVCASVCRLVTVAARHLRAGACVRARVCVRVRVRAGACTGS